MPSRRPLLPELTDEIRWLAITTLLHDGTQTRNAVRRRRRGKPRSIFDLTRSLPRRHSHHTGSFGRRLPRALVCEVMAISEAIHTQEDRAEAKKIAAFVVDRLRQMKLTNAAILVAESIEDTPSYCGFTPKHRRRICANNPLERIICEVHRRTQAVSLFPDGHAALLVTEMRKTVDTTPGPRAHAIVRDRTVDGSGDAKRVRTKEEKPNMSWSWSWSRSHAGY